VADHVVRQYGKIFPRLPPKSSLDGIPFRFNACKIRALGWRKTMAKAKLSGANELSNFKFDTSTYISLRPLSSLKTSAPKGAGGDLKPKEKAKG
jgi:hypothetical protein